MSSRVLRLQRFDACVLCRSPLAAGDRAWWDAEAKTVTCVGCHVRRQERLIDAAPSAATTMDVDGANRLPKEVPALVDRGRAGASAGREYTRRKANREARVRGAHPHVGRLLLWLKDAPQSERSFETGQLGEIVVGEALERRTAEGPAVIIHDRRMPGGHGNIDHIAIAPSGVYVIDAKAHSGAVKIETPLLGQAKLRIAGRDCTRLIDGLDRQVAGVRNTLARSDLADVLIQGVLCFTKADLPLLRTLKMRGHLLLYRKTLAKRLNSPGPITPDEIELIARALTTRLSAA